MSLAANRAKSRAKLQPDAKPSLYKPSLYKQIRLDIERRILTGEWPPGHRIPFEHEIMARYGCSRMTVNKALSELAQAELIERRRRAGSFVRRPQYLSAVLKIADIRAEISALGRNYGYELIKCSRRAANAADRARLGVPKTRRVVAIECHTWRIARPLTSVRLVYPGESHKLVARFNGS